LKAVAVRGEARRRTGAVWDGLERKPQREFTRGMTGLKGSGGGAMRAIEETARNAKTWPSTAFRRVEAVCLGGARGGVLRDWIRSR